MRKLVRRIDIPGAPSRPTPAIVESLAGAAGCSASERGSALLMLPVDSIRANPQQPRKRFDEADIESMARSLREHGAIQPIVVRPLSEPATETAEVSEPPAAAGGKHGEVAQSAGHAAGEGVARYELVAGECRLRAARLADLKEIPAIIKDVTDDQMLVLSLIENLHRKNLNAIEKARAYQILHDKHKWSHAKIGRRMGENPRSVSNTVRLLKLGADVLALVESGKLGIGHGKALLGVRDKSRQSELAVLAAGEGWAVRRLEREVRAQAGRSNAHSPAASDMARGLKARLESALNVEVVIHRRRGGGELLEIEFRDSQGMPRLAALLENEI